MRLAYVCADPGIPVFGSKGCSIHVQEFLRAAQGLGHELTLIAARVENAPPADLRDVHVVHSPLPSAAKGTSRELVAYQNNEAYLSALREHAPFGAVYERYSLWSTAGMAYAAEAGIPGILEVNAPLIEEQAQHRDLANRDLAESVARVLSLIHI